MKRLEYVLWENYNADGYYLIPAEEVEEVEDHPLDGSTDFDYTGKLYTYNDGGNVKYLTEDGRDQTHILASEDYVSLDKWDGRNYVYGSVGEHRDIHKVYEVDGEEVENTFLVYDHSQWQGSINKGFLVDNLKAFLIENGDYEEEEYEKMLGL